MKSNASDKLGERVTRRQFSKEVAMVAAAGAVTPSSLYAQTGDSSFDLVIKNGRVMDPETGFDGIRNVGIRDGRITAITDNSITGKETIDAIDHVVAPGFIDQHFHWTRPMGYKLGLRDGVTTALDLEMGTEGTHVEEYYAIREGKTQPNFGAAVSHEFARQLVLDGLLAKECIDAVETRQGKNWADKKVSLEEGNAILKHLDEGLRSGGLGVGSTLGYMRNGVTARELFEVQKMAAAYGRQTGVHLRYTPGDTITEPIGAAEVLTNALALGAPALICHFNNPGWQLIQPLLSLLQRQGHNVWGEIYPYAAGSTVLNAVFLKPEVWVKQLGYKYEDSLMDPETSEFYTLQKYEADVAREPTKVVIVYKMPESEIEKWLRLPGVTMASDGMPILGDITWDTPYENLPNTHPRTAGAHAASLRIGREKKIPLMQTLSQLCYVSAKHLGDMGLESMKERGRMQQGKVADIVIFDPATVQDNSTYANGAIPSTGIPHVIVNGVLVVKDSEALKDVNPGQPIRFPVEAKGRFKPLVVGDWYEQHLVAPVDFCGTVPYGHDHSH